MDSTNQFSQEVEQDSAVQPQQSPANPVGEELNDTELDAILNDTELDAIAGGFSFHNWRDIPRFSWRRV